MHWRQFGKNPAIPDKCNFHELEEQYLLDVHRRHKRHFTAQHLAVDWKPLDRKQITQDFNERFANKKLSGRLYKQLARTLS